MDEKRPRLSASLATTSFQWQTKSLRLWSDVEFISRDQVSHSILHLPKKEQQHFLQASCSLPCLKPGVAQPWQGPKRKAFLKTACACNKLFHNLSLHGFLADFMKCQALLRVSDSFFFFNWGYLYEQYFTADGQKLCFSPPTLSPPLPVGLHLVAAVLLGRDRRLSIRKCLREK